MNTQRIDPFDPPEQSSALDNEWWDLRNRHDEIREAVFDNLPHGNPVRDAFWQCHGGVNVGLYNDHLLPNREALRDALDKFDALPREERKRILNGWDVPPELHQEGREEILKDAENDSMHSGLLFEIDEWHHRRSLLDVCDFTNYVTKTSSPVAVIIQVSTRKMQAINALRALADQLERGWEIIIAPPPAR